MWYFYLEKIGTHFLSMFDLLCRQYSVLKNETQTYDDSIFPSGNQFRI